MSDADTGHVFNAGVEVGLGPAKLRDIRQLLEDTYCQAIGAEYRYIRNPIKPNGSKTGWRANATRHRSVSTKRN